MCVCVCRLLATPMTSRHRRSAPSSGVLSHVCCCEGDQLLQLRDALLCVCLGVCGSHHHHVRARSSIHTGWALELRHATVSCCCHHAVGLAIRTHTHATRMPHTRHAHASPAAPAAPQSPWCRAAARQRAALAPATCGRLGCAGHAWPRASQSVRAGSTRRASCVTPARAACVRHAAPCAARQRGGARALRTPCGAVQACMCACAAAARMCVLVQRACSTARHARPDAPRSCRPCPCLCSPGVPLGHPRTCCSG